MYATKLLSSFAKVFTYFLQREGFTLGVLDILVRRYAEEKRTEVINQSRAMGAKIMSAALDMPNDTAFNDVVEKFVEASTRNPKIRAIIDRQYKTSLDAYTNNINRYICNSRFKAILIKYVVCRTHMTCYCPM